YALLALSLVLVFAVTRVVFIPQGEFVAYGALTYATLGAGRAASSAFLLSALGVAACGYGFWAERRTLDVGTTLRLLGETILLPALALALWLAPRRPGIAVNAALALLIVAPMAPYMYRIAFQPLAEASVLVLLI